MPLISDPNIDVPMVGGRTVTSPPLPSSSTAAATATAAATTTSTTSTTAKRHHQQHRPKRFAQQHQKLEDHYGSLLTRRQPTYIARLILVMQDCLSKIVAVQDETKEVGDASSSSLRDDLLLSKLEQMAILIHESMSSSSRNYHSVQHVFDISKSLTDPIAVLAALFHDVIYYNIDGGLSPAQAKILFLSSNSNTECDDDEHYNNNSNNNNNQNLQLPIHDSHPDRVVLRTQSPCGVNEQPDTLLCMVERIFGYVEGQGVSFKMGLNEFLSAVIAVRCLHSCGLLSMAQLAQIACCIEATIPFRPNDPITGQTPMETLYDRMVLVNQEFQLNMADDELVESVQRAALLANEDISNFGMKDRNWFLDNTWSLLPETNESLRHQYLYTVEEFQQAVYKMNGFFNFLQPQVVFSSFRHVPSDEHIASCVTECRRNLQVGKKYVGAKLLAISVLAAFCELTGGDAPMSLFMGDLPSRHHVSHRLEDSLPHISIEQVVQDGVCDRDVYSILYMGRRTETSFDIRQSPMAAYLYASLGDDGLQRVLLQDCPTLYPMTKTVALQLLAALPQEVVMRIAHNMANVAISRSNKILQVLEDLQNMSTTTTTTFDHQDETASTWSAANTAANANRTVSLPTTQHSASDTNGQERGTPLNMDALN